MSFQVSQLLIGNQDGLILGTNGTNTCTINTSGLTGPQVIYVPNATDTLVGRSTTDILTNKTLLAPIISTIITQSSNVLGNTGSTLTLPTTTDTLVGRLTTDTLTNKTLILPNISTIGNTGATLTLPTTTDTIVGRSTIDTLTNKTLIVPNISTIGNTGATLTLPTITDTIVGRLTTDTLTNKTLIGTTNTIEANRIGQGSNAVTISGQPQNNYTIVATGTNTATWQQNESLFLTGTINTTNNQTSTILSVNTTDNTSYGLTINIIGKQTSNTIGITYGATITSFYKRLTGNNSLTQIQSDVKTLFKDTGTSSWSVSTSANTTNGVINILCAGANNTNITWSATCNYIYV